MMTNNKCTLCWSWPLAVASRLSVPVHDGRPWPLQQLVGPSKVLCRGTQRRRIQNNIRHHWGSPAATRRGTSNAMNSTKGMKTTEEGVYDGWIARTAVHYAASTLIQHFINLQILIFTVSIFRFRLDFEHLQGWGRSKDYQDKLHPDSLPCI